MRIKETVCTLFALGFCFMSGVAGYHQVVVADRIESQYRKNYITADAVYVSTDDSIDTLNKLQVEVPEDIKVLCAKYGAEYGIEPELLEAIAWRESRFTANVISENGVCKGLMQINPHVHKERMERLGVEDLFDPDGNIKVAADYLAELLAENSNLDYALTRYHGESRPEKILNGAKPSNYVRTIRKVADSLKNTRKEV